MIGQQVATARRQLGISGTVEIGGVEITAAAGTQNPTDRPVATSVRPAGSQGLGVMVLVLAAILIL